jgi:hypothetical protein
MSKTVFFGFMAAWFFAASPIRRSFSVNETNEGVVKFPCSFATAAWLQPKFRETVAHPGACILGGGETGGVKRGVLKEPTY